ncbi:Serine carboxypeptidase-like 29 [Dendrobium catenatum]|uniref:Serine carboxypeptidase-like 29 n=1 Tax=Dendrobium catenatum TaxID=906689 RepID=A0A2I0V7U8_9ASPA|nr:Serine carboxypeptidase-like 29 [Dendrobium catenatum]
MMEMRGPGSKFPFLRPFFVLLFFFFSASKAGGESPYEIQQRDKVFLLPGQSFNVSFAHYSGYVTLDEESGKALFYWFFEAVEDPHSKPLVLWLNGGKID